MAHCPNCSTVPEGRRLTEAMNRFGFIGRGQRLTCAGCGARLAIRAARANLAWSGLLVSVGLLLIWAARLANDETGTAALVAIALFAIFLHYRLAPRLVRLELPAFGEEDRTPLDVEMMRVGPEDSVAEATPPSPEAPAGPAVQWQCRSCREQNPAGFEICWNCGAVWDQRADDSAGMIRKPKQPP